MLRLPLQHFTKASSKFPQIEKPTLFCFYYLKPKLLFGLWRLPLGKWAAGGQQGASRVCGRGSGSGCGVIFLRLG